MTTKNAEHSGCHGPNSPTSSHYEGSAFPLSQLKRQNVSFIYTKATQGTRYGDPTFDHNWKVLGALPADQAIPRGAYHFLSSDRAMSGKAQADSFVDFVTRHGGFKPEDLRPALDLEWDVTCSSCPDRWRTNGRTPAEILETTRDFLMQVKARTGRGALLYTNKSFLKDNKIDSTEFIKQLPAGSKIWIFDVDAKDRQLELPNPSTNLDHALWQFSFAGTVASGFSGNFDVSVFKGTEAEFRKALIDEN
jgi:lysozyme